MLRGFYVSCESALGHNGLIPEYAPVVVSVCTSRPRRWDNPLGSFLFRHIRRDLLREYRYLELGDGQGAFVATPEKALLDLIFLTPGGDPEAYIRSLRSQNLEILDTQALRKAVEVFGKPELMRAAEIIESLLTGPGFREATS